MGDYPLMQFMITVSAPKRLGGKEGRYELAAFYGDLLGMQIVSEGWLKIAKARGNPFELVLDGDGWSDARPPRWGDPHHPQQMHLDIGAPDLAAAGSAAESQGAALLAEDDDHGVYADPAGHPFCLYADDSLTEPTVLRLVFDCFSPRALAGFYEGLLGIDHDGRVVDTPARVEIALGDDRYPNLAFQHAQFVACRWPDEDYPAQLHVDYRFGEGKAAAIERAERLGGIRLPQLADTTIFADPASHPFCL